MPLTRRARGQAYDGDARSNHGGGGDDDDGGLGDDAYDVPDGFLSALSASLRATPEADAAFWCVFTREPFLFHGVDGRRGGWHAVQGKGGLLGAPVGTRDVGVSAHAAAAAAAFRARHPASNFPRASPLPLQPNLLALTTAFFYFFVLPAHPPPTPGAPVAGGG